MTGHFKHMQRPTLRMPRAHDGTARVRPRREARKRGVRRVVLEADGQQALALGGLRHARLERWTSQSGGCYSRA
jgi:hypothetical protein